MVLVIINIVVGVYVLAVITATAVLLSLSAQRPIEERDEPLFGDGPSRWYDAVFGNDTATIIGGVAFVGLIVAFAWLVPQYLKERHSSFLTSFPGLGLGMKLVGPLMFLLLAPSIGGGWAVGVYLTSVIMTAVVVSTLLTRLSKLGSSGTKEGPALMPVPGQHNEGGTPPIDIRHRLRAQA